MINRREFIHRFIDLMENKLWRLLPKEASEGEMIEKTLKITIDMAKHIQDANDGQIKQ